MISSSLSPVSEREGAVIAGDTESVKRAAIEGDSELARNLLVFWLEFEHLAGFLVLKASSVQPSKFNKLLCASLSTLLFRFDSYSSG